MKNYIFHTCMAVKNKDAEKYWIEKNVIKDIFIQAKDIPSALKLYAKQVEEKTAIAISPSALKRKQPMYFEYKDGTSQQVGYVITGKTSFHDDCHGWVNRYIDLWTDIREYVIPNFK